jgi:hypothetical protein
MSDWKIDEPQLLALNSYLQRADDVLIHNCLTRTAQESKLFPIMPYLMMCFYDAYYRFPDLLRKSTEHVTPEDIGHRARSANINLQKVTSWGMLNFYLNGRTCLIKSGLLRPEDNLEDLWFMVDFHHRMGRAYHRNAGHVWTLDSNDIGQEHDERVLQVFEADAFEADHALRRAAARFVAAGTQYNFLVHCESRVGLGSSGPYRLAGRKLLHTRHFTNQAECDFSWLDGVADGVTYNNLTITLITDGVAIEVTDFGTAYTTPEDYQDGIVGVGLYTSDVLTDRYIPVGMGSRQELTDTLESITAEIQEATRKLYSRFAEMSNDQMVEAGIYVYFQAPTDVLHIAGVYDQADWEFIDERTRRMWEFHTEEYSLDAYVSHFAAMDGYESAQNEYYLHPISYPIWRRSGGKGDLPPNHRNANFVPASVLDSHDYPRRVNANGLADCHGTSSLPAKSTSYTFHCGKLSMDEMNQRARDFKSPLLESPWRNVDEQTVKWHYQEPVVDDLYKYTQERSRLLAGRGASLVRSDIDRIRTEAGEKPWHEVVAASTAEEAVTT